MTILLIEDSEPDAELFKRFMLAGKEWDVTIATTLEDGLRYDSTWGFDAVILDLNLLPSSPHECTIKRIKEFKAPVVVLTCVPDYSLQSRSLVEGAKLFFQKIDAIHNPDKFLEELRGMILKSALA